MIKLFYIAPTAEVLAVVQEAIVCASGDSGTEAVVIGGVVYTDSDFE